MDESPLRIHIPHRALQGIPIHTRPVHQPERVGLQVTPGRRVVVAVPVLVQPGLGLEPLAGEAQALRRQGAGIHVDRMDAAEGGVGCGPDHRAGGVGRHDRPVDVVDVDVEGVPALDHRDGVVLQPDVLAQEGAAGAVVLDDPVAPPVEDRKMSWSPKFGFTLVAVGGATIGNTKKGDAR